MKDRPEHFQRSPHNSCPLTTAEVAEASKTPITEAVKMKVTAAEAAKAEITELEIDKPDITEAEPAKPKEACGILWMAVLPAIASDL